MNGMPARLEAVIDVLESGGSGNTGPGLRMLDGSDGAARLVFTSSGKRRRVGLLPRWLAVVRVQPPPGHVTRAAWVLDGRTTRWRSGRWRSGLPPGELHRGVTGLDSEATPMLWFHARGGEDGQCSLTAAGVFQVAGIVDAAQLRITRRRLRKHIRLRMTVDTQMWGLSAMPVGKEDTAAAPGPRLTIAASGVPRPLEPEAINQWL
jgi:hypothetical protein